MQDRENACRDKKELVCDEVGKLDTYQGEVLVEVPLVKLTEGPEIRIGERPTSELACHYLRTGACPC
jgi:hypothetical protein